MEIWTLNSSSKLGHRLNPAWSFPSTVTANLQHIRDLGRLYNSLGTSLLQSLRMGSISGAGFMKSLETVHRLQCRFSEEILTALNSWKVSKRSLMPKATAPRRSKSK